MKNIIKKAALLLFIGLSATSCHKPENPIVEEQPTNTPNIRYEFKTIDSIPVDLYISYTGILTENDNNRIITTPWTKEIYLDDEIELIYLIGTAEENSWNKTRIIGNIFDGGKLVATDTTTYTNSIYLNYYRH